MNAVVFATRHSIRTCAIAFVLLTSSLAFAGKREAMALYEKGESAYNAQRFAEAIDLFERAYAEHPAPEFLFNIAQAHRRLGHCEEALVFYRRYLEQLPATKLRAEVEGHVARLRAQCIEPLDLAATKAVDEPPKASTSTRTSSAQPQIEAAPTPALPEQPPAVFFVGSVASGIAILSVPPYSIPAQLSLKGDAGARYDVNSAVSLEGTARIDTAAVPYRSNLSEGTARETGLGVSLALIYRPVDRTELKLSVGGGVAMLSGLAVNNPFTSGGAARDLLALPSADFAVGARFKIGTIVFLSPEVSYTIAWAGDSLANKGAISRLDVTAGIGLLL